MKNTIINLIILILLIMPFISITLSLAFAQNGNTSAAIITMIITLLSGGIIYYIIKNN
jgi:hypothetical protein